MSVPVILGQEPFLDFPLGVPEKPQPRIRIDLFITNLLSSIWLRENIDVRDPLRRVGGLERGRHPYRQEHSLWSWLAAEYLKGRKAFLSSLRTSSCTTV